MRRALVRRLCLIALLSAGCGRIWYDPLDVPGTEDAGVTIDAGVDAGTVEIDSGFDANVEITCSGGEWLDRALEMCRTCPAPGVPSCAAIDLAATSWDAATGTMRIVVRGGTADPDSGDLNVLVFRMSTRMFQPDTVPLTVENGVLIADVSRVLSDPDDIQSFVIDRLVLRDRCGIEQTVIDFKARFTYMPLAFDTFYCGS